MSFLNSGNRSAPSVRSTVVLGLLGALSAHAQAAPTLKEFVDGADKANIDRRISAEQRARAAAELTQAWGTLFPTLTVQGSWTHNQYEAAVTVPSGTTVNKLVIQPFDQLDGILRIDLPLIDTTRWFRLLAASTAAEASVERENAMRELVRRQVMATYFGYAASTAVLNSAKKSLGVAEAQLQLSTTRFQTGVATELEQMRSKAEVERAKQLVADATTAVANTRRSLRTLTGLEASGDVSLPQDDLHEEPALNTLEDNIEQLPAIKASDKDIEAAGRFATLQKLTLVPTINGQFTERFTNATGFAGQAAFFNLGLNLTWRLDASLILGISVQAHAEETARLAAERARLQARDQVHSDWQRISSSIAKVRAAEVQVQAAQRAAQLARERYEAGVATQIDVITSERDVFTAEVAQIQAKTELASARASLKISTAQPLF